MKTTVDLSFRVPKDRIGVIIGKNGTTKKIIEKKTHTRIIVDSENNLVRILSKETGERILDAYKAQAAITAIARGFSEKKALKLLEPDYQLEIIEIPGSPKRTEIIRGRLIGKKGKFRQYLEEKLNCYISIRGNTVAVIASSENLPLVINAINMIIEGRKHATVVNYLEQQLKLETDSYRPISLWKTKYSDIPGLEEE